jgi:amino acid adenylation domain-containing protein
MMSTVKTKVPIFDNKLKEARDYWIKKLSREIEPSTLRTDFESPADAATQAQAFRVTLPADLSHKLTRLTGDSPFLLYTALMAALKVCLHKYTGSDLIVVGSPARQKDNDQTPTVNALAVVDEINSRLTFRKFLMNVRENLVEAYAHQGYPFERVLRDLQLRHVANRCALFDVALGLRNIHGPMPEVRNGITFTFLKTAAEITGDVQYNSNIFREETVRRFTNHFLHLLSTALDNIDESIGNLEILTAEEHRQLLYEWNETRAEYPREECIHEMFAAQAHRTPDAIALVLEEQTLSYAELNRKANQLAHYLRAQGIGAESLVGLMMERSIEMIVSVLGILKAGAAYLPLDPAYPQERLAFMLEDAAVQMLLTQQRLAGRLPWSEAQVLFLDSQWSEMEQESVEEVGKVVGAKDAAYVIYTSGSTGRPKGVVVEHGGVSNLVRAQVEAFGVEAGSRVLQFASLSFDASASEIAMALTTGASLYLGSREELMSGSALTHLLREQEITTVTLPPAILSMLAAEDFPKLKTVIAAGDVCSADIMMRWMEGRHFFNAYGPTEASVCASLTECTEPRPEGPTIGRPISNTQIYLLDQHLQPVPLGVPAQLFIAGHGLARGYLNRPELTAEKFIPHPFSQTPGARLYKTGDLARFLPDGTIEFLGRLDHQVKIRGFRIELGEVEAALLQHEGVRETLVMAREDVPGEKRLVAYLVLAEGAEPGISALRRHLQERLPEYMIPGAFVKLEEMPLSPNGKVARGALPAPERERMGVEQAYVGARTAVEEMLGGIWGEVLGVERVGIEDNFFELGGHSLLGTQIVSRVRETFKVEIALNSLFESPTLSGLAQCIELALRGGQELQSPPIERVARDIELPLSFAQQRLWFLDRLEPGSSTYNISSAVRLTGRLNIPALEQTLSEIVRRHEILRTTLATVEGRTIQVIAPAQPLLLPLVNLSDLPEAEREERARLLATAEARKPFDLTRGPLLRASLLRLHHAQHVLLFTMHHIISDGWSMGLLVREVAALYSAFSLEKPAPLPELPIQYADFAHWQHQWLQGPRLEDQLAYWKEQLRGPLPVLALPTDRVRPAVQSFRGARHSIQIGAEMSQGLKGLSQRLGATLFMTMLGAFQTLLMRYSGQEEIVVGTPIANRTRGEVEGLIGFFVNTLVLRVEVRGSEGFTELVERVKEVSLGAYAHQELPFEKLVEELEPERSLSHTPLFQVMFVLQNAPGEALQLPELVLSNIPIENKAAKFDLTMTIDEAGEELIAALEYNTDLFDAGTIERMLGHFHTLLEAIIAEPARPLSQLSLLREPERHQLLSEWNRTATDYPQEQCIHEMFAAQAHRTPDAVALVLEEQTLSYAELNRKANQLAHYLRAQGIGAESLVGLMMERSIEMIVSVLGILKAGAAYLPLDPAYPQERLAFMLEDAAVQMLLTQQRLAGRLPWSEAQVLFLDSQWSEMEQESVEEVGKVVGAKDAAYVIYTSGSTGRPKGVVVEHGGVSNLVRAQVEAFGVEAGSRVLQFASLSFDASLFEIAMALPVGATLYLGRQESLLPGPGFVELLREQAITIATLPPSVLANLPDAELPALKTITVAGEACPAEVVARWAEGRRFFNLYGPTEATVWATAAECAGGERRPPIGRPIPNAEILLLDSNLQPVPIGVAGEIYIGGDGLARGYLNRPDLTAQSFIPHPFSERAGARLYRSGDLARYLPDGQIEFVGRVDEQVKIRGFRIELGEVEAALLEQPAVREALVMAREDVPGDRRLVAYVVPEEEAAPKTTELRAALGERLPGYMIPSSFVLLEALPLSPNGKVDRRALPAPEGYQAELEATYIAPRSEIESTIAGIWQEALHLKKVGVHDNFFSLGGHSVLMAQVHTRLREVFKKELSMIDLFKYPTIDALAKYLNEEADEQPSLGESHDRAEVRRELLKRQTRIRQRQAV